MSEIDKIFEGLETPPESGHKPNTEPARKRALKLARFNFEKLIYEKDQYTDLATEEELVTEYRSTAIGSFVDPRKPDAVNHLIAVPFIFKGARWPYIQGDPPRYEEERYGIMFETVNNKGPEQSEVVATYEVSLLHPPKLEGAEEFNQLCNDLFLLENPITPDAEV